MNERRAVKLLMTFIVLGCFMCGVIGNLGGEPPKKPPKKPLPERDWGPELNGCRLAIEVDKEKFDPCTPIVLRLYIRNVGKTPLIFLSRNMYLDTPLAVKDDKGNPIPETSFGKSILHSGYPGGISGGELNNGEEEEITILINRLYDMTKRGTYSITATRREIVKRDDKGNPIIIEDKSTGTKKYERIKLTSNTLKVQVR